MAAIESFFHVAIKTTDIDREIEFYRAYLDAELLDRVEGEGEAADDVSHAVLSVGDKRVYLFETAPYEAAGLVDDVEFGFLHFGFVVDDIDAVVTDLMADDVPVVMEPTRFGDLKIAFFTAPSGTRIELLEHLDE